MKIFLYQKVFVQKEALKKESDVVIIDIDEQSLGKFGQFNHGTERVFAKILDQLNIHNPVFGLKLK